MELRLEKEEIEQALLIYVNRMLPEAGINRVQWDFSYSVQKGRALEGATFDHTDLPPETGDE